MMGMPPSQMAHVYKSMIHGTHDGMVHLVVNKYLDYMKLLNIDL